MLMSLKSWRNLGDVAYTFNCIFVRYFVVFKVWKRLCLESTPDLSSIQVSGESLIIRLMQYDADQCQTGFALFPIYYTYI